MGVLKQIEQTARGIKGFIQGIKWLKNNPFKLFLLLFIPILLSMGLFFLGWSLFSQYQDALFSWLMFSKPESWWGIPFYYIAKAILYLAIILLSLIFMALLVNVFSSPIYEYVSVAIEKDLSNGKLVEVTFWESIKLIKEELKKVIFIISLSLLLLAIPGVNIIAPLVTAFCVGWDFYDYPLARRGWSFRRRLHFVFSNFGTVFGLGLWMLIPGVQFILMPLAIAGGTFLAVEDLQRYEKF